MARYDQDPAALVRETSTTTGTGSLTLAGAVTGFRTFADAYPEGADCYVPYSIRMGSAYEYGIGILTAAATLTRSADRVHESSNAGGLVNFGAGTKIVESMMGAAPILYGKHNRAANVTVPTSGANGGPQYGYALGSLWRFAHDNDPDGPFSLFIHPGASGVGATAPERWPFLATGWNPVHSGGNFYDYRSLCWGGGSTNNHAEAQCNFFIGGGNGHNAGAFIHISAWLASGEVVQTERWAAAAATADATPAAATNYIGDYDRKYFIPEDSCQAITATVVAVKTDYLVAKSWEIKLLVRRAAGGAPVIVDTITKSVLHDDAAAAAWDVTIASDGVDELDTTVTGEAATNIVWNVDFKAVQVLG